MPRQQQQMNVGMMGSQHMPSQGMPMMNGQQMPSMMHNQVGGLCVL